MNLAEAALVLAGGVAAGTINTVVGSGTLITFPILLGIGLSPLRANVTNTVGLAPGSFSGAYGYRADLAGQRRRAIVLGSASLPGGVLGAVLLFVLPSSAFDTIVPVLVGLGVLLVVVGPWLTARAAAAPDVPCHPVAASAANSRSLARRATERHEPATVTPLLWALTFATGVYGGYFGAAQGVLLIGIFGVLLADSLQRMNALKNVLAGLVNGAAAVLFAFTGRVDWAAGVLLGAGAVGGGVLGARFGRRLPPVALRAVIVVVGVVALIKLLAD